MCTYSDAAQATTQANEQQQNEARRKQKEVSTSQTLLSLLESFFVFAIFGGIGCVGLCPFVVCGILVGMWDCIPLLFSPSLVALDVGDFLCPFFLFLCLVEAISCVLLFREQMSVQGIRLSLH